MFAYNQLSDLLTGELVTPIEYDSSTGNVICQTTDGEEVVYSFEDFDFSKTVAERTSTTTESTEKETTETEEEILVVESDGVTIGITVEPGTLSIRTLVSVTREGLITSLEEKEEILNMFNISYDNIRKVKIYAIGLHS